MNHSKIAVRYSKALFQAARKQEALELMVKDMQLLYKVCSVEHAQFMLENPVLTPSRKINIMEALFRGQVHQLTLNLIELVIRNRREEFFRDIARKFIADVRREKGISVVSLTTAGELDAKLRKRFTDLLEERTQQTIELDTQETPEIIGGFILKLDDRLMDASVRTHLHKIRKELLSTTFDKKI